MCAPLRTGSRGDDWLTSLTRGVVTLFALTLTAALTAPPAVSGPATGLARPVDQEPERLAFPARPGVCGTGDGILIRSRSGYTMHVSGDRGSRGSRDWRDGDPPCDTGVVVVELDGERGARTDVRLAVISRARARDRIPDWHSGQQAADRLLDEARTTGEGRVVRRLLFAATLADQAVVWPRLLELARDRSLPQAKRAAALHWLGRQAAERVADELGGMAGDRSEADEVREAAVFALAQLPPERAVPHLVEVARSLEDPRIRSRALFWLADFDDPRVVGLFEEILAGSGG